MNGLSMKTDNFEELFFFTKMDAKTFAETIGVSVYSIYRIKNHKLLPSLDTITKIAKYFNCRINFILMLDDDYDRKFGNGEYNFLEKFNIMLKLRNVTKYRIAKAVPLPESMIYNWLYNGTTPSLDSVVRLAQYFQCSVDYLLGYDNEIL